MVYYNFIMEPEQAFPQKIVANHGGVQIEQLNPGQPKVLLKDISGRTTTHLLLNQGPNHHRSATMIVTTEAGDGSDQTEQTILKIVEDTGGGTVVEGTRMSQPFADTESAIKYGQVSRIETQPAKSSNDVPAENLRIGLQRFLDLGDNTQKIDRTLEQAGLQGMVKWLKEASPHSPEE